MANIRLDLPYEIFDGTQLSFYAPCDSSEVENIIIYYPNNNGIASHVFVFKDAQENNLVNFNNLFVKDACVKVILSITKSAAYIQNANTNKYIEGHVGNKSNPHGVTASQVGLGNVPNVTTNNQTPTYSQASTLATLVSGEKLSVSFGKIMKAITDFISHIGNKSNPHGVTATQVGALKSSDVVDNLLSTSSTLPLSAKMGKQLNEKYRELTQAEYDSLSDSVKKNGTIYLITDVTDEFNAGQVAYDNSSSNLSAVDVQSAINELSPNRISFVDDEICCINENQVVPLSRSYGQIPIYQIGMYWHDTDGWCLAVYYLYNGTKYSMRVKLLEI